TSETGNAAVAPVPVAVAARRVTAHRENSDASRNSVPARTGCSAPAPPLLRRGVRGTAGAGLWPGYREWRTGVWGNNPARIVHRLRHSGSRTHIRHSGAVWRSSE